jgi:hypothetical protein
VRELTPDLATALPNLHFHPETLAEIRQALNSGKEVITHTDPISVPGWQGAGYVITDPETGAGAWKIGGGLNGAFLKKLSLNLLSLTNKISVPGWGAIIGALWKIGSIFDKCSGASFVEAVAIIALMAVVAFVATEVILIIAAATGPFAAITAIAGFTLLGALLAEAENKIARLCP